MSPTPPSTPSGSPATPERSSQFVFVEPVNVGRTGRRFIEDAVRKIREEALQETERRIKAGCFYCAAPILYNGIIPIKGAVVAYVPEELPGRPMCPACYDYYTFPRVS